MTTHMAHHFGTWLSYGGTARMVLAIVLLVSAGGIAYAGIRLPLPAWPPRPSEKARAVMLVTWLFAIAVLLVCVAAYVKQMRQEHLYHTPAADPITPVTFIGVGVVFFIIVVSNSSGGRVALTSAVAGALAAPMIFEFPFDLIVMARTYPPIPPDPALYRALFFVPLFCVEFTTLALLTLSPMVRLCRPAFFLFASMLGIFAVWGLSGFAYPSTPLPIALNVMSKLLAFAVALSLFFPQRARASAQRSELVIDGVLAPVRGVEPGRQTERREDLGVLEHRIPADALGRDREDLERVQLVSATDAPIGGEPGLAVGGYRLQTPVRSGLPEDPVHEQAVVAGAGEPVEHRRHLHEHILGE
jgi:hypothetical protein